jgi:hypothetical protein
MQCASIPVVSRVGNSRRACVAQCSGIPNSVRCNVIQKNHNRLGRGMWVRAQGTDGSSSAKQSEQVSGSSLLGGAPRTGSSLLGGSPTPVKSSDSLKSAAGDSKPAATSGSSLLGGAPPSGLSSQTSRSSAQSIAKMDVKDVELKSGVGVDYTTLRDLLAEAKWREAEDETRAKLIEAAGSGAQERNWVYWSEIKNIPIADMETLDALWAAASNGKFGYRVQRQMWIQNRKQWIRFFRAIDWVQGENDVYRKWPQEFKYEANAPKGHLPLTNALRGTRLFEAILEHPAFVQKK